MISNRALAPALALLLLPALSAAALQDMEETELAAIGAQGGMYLSGELNINKPYTVAGTTWNGPLWKKPLSSDPNTWAADERACGPNVAGGKTETCGMRIAVKFQKDAAGGWYVIDNLKGSFRFEGLTLQNRTINNDAGLNTGFAGDGTWFNGDVLEIGLPSKAIYKDVSFTVATSATAEWTKALDIPYTDPDTSKLTYKQNPLFSVKIDGEIRTRGNLLIFPAAGNK